MNTNITNQQLTLNLIILKKIMDQMMVLVWYMLHHNSSHTGRPELCPLSRYYHFHLTDEMKGYEGLQCLHIHIQPSWTGRPQPHKSDALILMIKAFLNSRSACSRRPVTPVARGCNNLEYFLSMFCQEQTCSTTEVGMSRSTIK